MRGLLRVTGLRSKIVLGFQAACLDEKPVNRPRIKREWRRVCDGGFHAADALAVGKEFDWSGIRVRFQLPNRRGIFVALKSRDGDDLEITELIGFAKIKLNMARSFAVGD